MCLCNFHSFNYFLHILWTISNCESFLSSYIYLWINCHTILIPTTTKIWPRNIINLIKHWRFCRQSLKCHSCRELYLLCSNLCPPEYLRRTIITDLPSTWKLWLAPNNWLWPHPFPLYKVPISPPLLDPPPICTGLEFASYPNASAIVALATSS